MISARREPLALASILAAATIRLFDLGRRSLWLDEAWAAVGSLDGPFDVAHVRHTPFLFAALVRLSAAVLGRSEVAVRLPATVFSIAAVVLAWRLGRDLVSRGGGAFAAAVVGLFPIPVYFGKELKPYSAELFLALAIAGLVRHLRHSPRSAPAWIGLLAAGVVGPGLGSVVILLVAGGLLVLLPAARRAPLAYGATAVACGLAGLAWIRLVFAPQLAKEPELLGYWHLFFLPAGPPGVVLAAALRSGMEAATFGLGPALPHHNDSMIRLPALPASAAYVVVAASLLGAVRLARDGEGWFVLLTLVWLVLLAAAAFAGRYPYGPSRIALFFVGPTAILLGAAADTIASVIPRRARPAGWLLVALPLLWPLRGAWRENVAQPFEREELRPVLERVLARRDQRDAVWVSPGAISAFRFYVPHPDPLVALAFDARDPLAIRRSLTATASRGDGRVWAVFGHRQPVEESMARAILAPGVVRDRIGATGASALLIVGLTAAR